MPKPKVQIFKGLAQIEEFWDENNSNPRIWIPDSPNKHGTQPILIDPKTKDIFDNVKSLMHPGIHRG